MSKHSKQRSFRRAFGAGAEAWKRKESEDLMGAGENSAEKGWNSEGATARDEVAVGEKASEEGDTLKKSFVWIALCGGLFVLGLVWMIFSVGEKPSGQVEKKSLVLSEGVEPQLEEGGIVIGLVDEDTAGDEYAHVGKSLTDLVEGFLQASSHEERLSYIVRPSEHGEAMKDFFEQKEREDETMGVVHTGNSVSSNGVQYTRMAVLFKNGSKRFVPVVNTQSGRFIDFEAYSRACSVPLMELLENGGECEYARVFIEPISYYNGVFEDDTRYQSYLITSPDLEDTQIYGYAEHGDATAVALQELLKGGAPIRVIVRLESVERSQERKQFHIDRVYCYGWVKAGLDIEVMIERRAGAALRESQ